MLGLGDHQLYSVEVAALCALLVALGLTAFVRPFTEDRPDLSLIAPLATAAGVRVLAAVALSASPSLARIRGTDEATFQTLADEIAREDAAEWLDAATGDLHLALFALYQRVFGETGAMGLRILQVGLAVAGIALVAIAVYDLAGAKAGRVTAWILAFEPASVFFSGLLHKESMLLFAEGVMALGAVRMWQRRDVTAGVILAAGGSLALATRPYAGAFLAAGAVAVTVHSCLREAPMTGKRAPLVAAGVMVITIAGLAVIPYPSRQLAVLQESQNANAVDDSNLRLEPVDFSSPADVALNLPRRLRDLMVRPYPWQVANTSQRLGVVGTAIAWALMGLLLVAFLVSPRTILERGPPLLYPAVAVAVAYALSIGNAGTGFRYRTHVVMLLTASLCSVAPAMLERLNTRMGNLRRRPVVSLRR